MSRARLATRATRDQGDHWPGFVDALATLLLVITFLLTVFMVSQTVLGSALVGRDKEIDSLRARLAELTEQLGLEKSRNETLIAELDGLRATLATSQAALAAAQNQIIILRDDKVELETTLEENQAQLAIKTSEAEELAALVDQLNKQLAQLNQALEASELKNETLEAQIFDLGKRLNAALATKVQELARYRSVFFEKLLEVLGDRSDVRVVGDRFVFETDVLFDSGSAELNAEGLENLAVIARAVREIEDEIPTDLNWVLQVDGHTDRVPINTAQYPSNWHLSAARAITVVNYFESLGVPPQRLAAAGYGEYQPIDGASLARNRRIELKLTNR